MFKGFAFYVCSAACAFWMALKQFSLRHFQYEECCAMSRAASHQLYLLHDLKPKSIWLYSLPLVCHREKWQLIQGGIIVQTRLKTYINYILSRCNFVYDIHHHPLYPRHSMNPVKYHASQKTLIRCVFFFVFFLYFMHRLSKHLGSPLAYEVKRVVMFCKTWILLDSNWFILPVWFTLPVFRLWWIRAIYPN